MRSLRAWRVFLYAAILINLAALILDALAGSVFVVAPVIMITALAVTIRVQTRNRRRREELDRPRPDYSAIAAMEREVYGETFDHDGAPSQKGRSNPDLGRCDFCDRPVYLGGMCLQCARKQKRSRVPFEDDRRAMRALAEARRGTIVQPEAELPPGYVPPSAALTPRKPCRLCDRMERGHRSNLRWERPS